MRADVVRPFLYAIRRRCPRCGGGSLFHGWFQMEPTCPQCELDFERNPGAFIGGVGLNTTVTFAAVAISLGLAFALTDSGRTIFSVLFWPLLLAAVLPLVFFPYSKTLWLAVELVTTPPTDEDGIQDELRNPGSTGVDQAQP